MRDRHQTALCMSSRGDGAREEGGRRREEEEEQERAKGRKEGGGEGLRAAQRAG